MTVSPQTRFQRLRGKRTLDTYDPADINDEDQEDLTAAQRRKAEQAMARRDRQERGSVVSGQLHDREHPIFSWTRTMKKKAKTSYSLACGGRTRHQYDERIEDDDVAGIETVSDKKHKSKRAVPDIVAGNATRAARRCQGKSVAEWVAIDRVRRSIAINFRQFLTSYTDEQGNSVHYPLVRNLGESEWPNSHFCLYPNDFVLDNAESLEISYTHLAEHLAIIAYFIIICPTAILDIFDEVALSVVLISFPHYERIHSEIHVRITDLPSTVTLRDLRRTHLNNLVRVSGVVTRRSGVFPQLKKVHFDCKNCGVTLGPFIQESSKEISISYCPQCEKKGQFKINQEQVLFTPLFLSKTAAENRFRPYTVIIRR